MKQQYTIPHKKPQLQDRLEKGTEMGEEPKRYKWR